MLDLLIEIASWFLIVCGSFFHVCRCRWDDPNADVFTRMHAASVIDTVGAGMLIVGMMLQADSTLVALKLAFIILLLFFTSPVAAHALAQAALTAGQLPQLKEDRTDTIGTTGTETSEKSGG